jgi:hypothetical protein
MSDIYDRRDGGLDPALTEQLLEISRKALVAGAFEMAYHALASALHAAEVASDTEQLVKIQQEALRQQDVVDREAPGHRLSRSAGREQGRSGWHEVLAGQVTAILSRHRAAAALAASAARRQR